MKRDIERDIDPTSIPSRSPAAACFFDFKAADPLNDPSDPVHIGSILITSSRHSNITSFIHSNIVVEQTLAALDRVLEDANDVAGVNTSVHFVHGAADVSLAVHDGSHRRKHTAVLGQNTRMKIHTPKWRNGEDLYSRFVIFNHPQLSRVMMREGNVREWEGIGRA